MYFNLLNKQTNKGKKRIWLLNSTRLLLSQVTCRRNECDKLKVFYFIVYLWSAELVLIWMDLRLIAFVSTHIHGRDCGTFSPEQMLLFEKDNITVMIFSPYFLLAILLLNFHFKFCRNMFVIYFRVVREYLFLLKVI